MFFFFDSFKTSFKEKKKEEFAKVTDMGFSVICWA